MEIAGPIDISPFLPSGSSISTLQYLNSLSSTKPLELQKTQFIKEQQIPIRTLSLLLLSQTSLHDFDLLTIDNGRVSCNRRLLSLRWVSFGLRLMELEGVDAIGEEVEEIVANGLVGNASPSSIIDDYSQFYATPPPTISCKETSIRSYRIPLSKAATTIFVHWIYTLSLPPTSSFSTSPSSIQSPTSPSFASKSAPQESLIEIYSNLLLFSTNENLLEFKALVVGKLLELMESGSGVGVTTKEDVEELVEIAGLCGDVAKEVWLRGLTLLYENNFSVIELVESSNSEIVTVITEESTLIPSVLVASLQSYSVHSFSRPSPPPSPLKNSFLPSPTPSSPVSAQSFSNPFSPSSLNLTTPIVPRRNSKVLEYRRTSQSNFTRRGSLQDIFIESPPGTPSSLYSGESSPASSAFSNGSTGSGSLRVEGKVVRGSMERLTRSWREEEELQAQKSQQQQYGLKKPDEENDGLESNRDIPKIVVVDYRNSLLPPLPASGSYSILDEDIPSNPISSNGLPSSPSRMSFSVNLKGIKKKLSLVVGRNGSVAEMPPSPSPSISRESFFSQQQQTIRPTNGYQSSTIRSNSSSVLSNGSTGSLAERSSSGTGFSRGKMPFGLNLGGGRD